MKKSELTYRPLGDETLLIEWPSQIREEILYDILSFQKIIEEELKTKIEETQTTYNSLALFFNPEIISLSSLVDSIKKIRAKESKRVKDFSTAVWEIPVCYDLEFGVDLEAISKEKNLSVEEIVKLHSENLYTVYFIGFLPGFLYLGGLSEKLFTPRKQTPRLKILKGAVAIGGSQTGIYPKESPGGWSIIGNCPTPLFDMKKDPPSLIKAGDKIKFSAISKGEHDAILEKINRGSFELKSQPL